MVPKLRGELSGILHAPQVLRAAAVLITSHSQIDIGPVLKQDASVSFRISAAILNVPFTDIASPRSHVAFQDYRRVGMSLFRLAVLEYNGRIRPRTSTDGASSDEKWQVLVSGIDISLTRQWEAGTPVDLIVTSELPTYVSGGDAETDRAQFVPGPRTDAIASLARCHSCWIVVNPAEKDPDFETNGNLYNTILLYDRSGELAATYRKVRLPSEQKRFTPGGHPVVVPTEFGRLGILNCFEISTSFKNEDYVAEVMALHPHILVHPSWGHFGDEPIDVAREYGVFIASSVWDGSSRIIGPEGVLDEQHYSAYPSLPTEMKLAVADVPIGNASG